MISSLHTQSSHGARIGPALDTRLGAVIMALIRASACDYLHLVWVSDSHPSRRPAESAG